jgi:hypothetical protein
VESADPATPGRQPGGQLCKAATWRRLPALEAPGGAARSFQRSFAAGKNLLHSLVALRVGAMRDVTYRARGLARWF